MSGEAAQAPVFNFTADLIKDFRPVWSRLKSGLTEEDRDFFYRVINIDDTVGRRFYDGCGREDNPRFMSHWFPHGRCHANVIFPCYLLNGRKESGRYSVLSNNHHAVILDTKTGAIFDPTYSAMVGLQAKMSRHRGVDETSAEITVRYLQSCPVDLLPLRAAAEAAHPKIGEAVAKHFDETA